MRDLAYNNRALTYGLAALVIVLHSYFLYASLAHQQYLTDDSIQYLTLAENLKSEGVFSQSYVAPFVPDMQRTPGYPLFLLALGQFVPLILFVQHVLVLLSGYVLFKLIRDLIPAKVAGGEERRNWFAKLGAWAYLIQPYPIIFASYILSETLFIFFFLVALLLFLRFFKEIQYGPLLLSLPAFAAAAYVRPIAMPLMVLAVLIAVIRLLRPAKYRPHHHRQPSPILILPALGLSMALFLGPWMLRNQAVSGRLTFNVMGDMGMIHGRLGGLDAFANRRGTDEHQLYMAGDSIAALELGLPNVREYYSVKQNHETELYAGGMIGMTVKHFLKHPGTAILFQGRNLTAMLSGVGYGWARQLSKRDGLAYASAGLQGLMNLLMYIGCLIALGFIRRWTMREYLLFGGIAAVLLVSAAAWADGRYRVIVDPLMLALGAWALAQFLANASGNKTTASEGAAV